MPLDAAITAMISALGTLYLWEEHKGHAPDVARSTRTWDVRDWMKKHKFNATALPGLHLRDAVVESLRNFGMTLTPKPLTHTANEYYAMRYDRMADPRGPFGRRRIKTAPPPPVIEAVEAAAPEPVAETPAEITEPVDHTVVEAEPEVEIATGEDAAPAVDEASGEPEAVAASEVSAEAETEPEDKPIPA